ncbi:hypothetical protein [Confluentibacter citreus]|uniref:hypothetical protein n=1 Tax=Confluentibacter citreus TaxID=2007307 RepID=UPI000C293B64|nr:hypothetical protein [Confluentibacter citreus]
MSKKQIVDFIKSNGEDKIKDYFYKLLEKLESVKSENHKIQLWLLVLVIIHFGIDFNFFNNIDLGFISLETNNHFLKLCIPIIFTFMLLQFATLNVQRAIVIDNIREIGIRYFKLEPSLVEKSFYSNIVLRSVMPFSLSEEINEKFFHNGKVGILTTILTWPLFLIFLAPFIYEYFAIKDQMLNYWGSSWFENFVIILNIWLLIVVITYYIKLVVIAVKEAQR